MTVLAEASAPANIALIKYMGKSDLSQQMPANASMSFTLENFRTFVRIKASSETADSWSNLAMPSCLPMQLSEQGIKKFLKHFEFLKGEFSLQGNFCIESANNFPSDCGLASSASSFAALTLAAYNLRKKLKPELAPLTTSQVARLSRRGSGSSIRSFAGPWVAWQGEDYSVLDLPQNNILHSVVIVEQSKKDVSSSQAHARVKSSLLFPERPQRAELRLEQLLEAFQKNQWRQAFEICWAEFWDMHALFETSQPHFGYMNDLSLKVLRTTEEVWRSGDGPIVTMDAGANVHLLYRADQAALRENLKKTLSSWSQVL